MLNTEITAPPSTHAEMAEKIAPDFGKKPHTMSPKAPIAIHHLLTTLVIDTIPEFCPNAVFCTILLFGQVFT